METFTLLTAFLLLVLVPAAIGLAIGILAGDDQTTGFPELLAPLVTPVSMPR